MGCRPAHERLHGDSLIDSELQICALACRQIAYWPPGPPSMIILIIDQPADLYIFFPIHQQIHWSIKCQKLVRNDDRNFFFNGLRPRSLIDRRLNVMRCWTLWSLERQLLIIKDCKQSKMRVKRWFLPPSPSVKHLSLWVYGSHFKIAAQIGILTCFQRDTNTFLDFALLALIRKDGPRKDNVQWAAGDMWRNSQTGHIKCNTISKNQWLSAEELPWI